MRCPKCHYISFDSGDRCRNCGYDFSLTVDVTAPDLPIAEANAPEGPLADFALEGARPVPPRAPDTASDLPLFTRGSLDRALDPPPPAPRVPLGVRRSSPPPREKLRVPDEPTLDLGAPDLDRPRRRAGVFTAEAEAPVASATTASLFPRIGAALIDMVLMGAIHIAVIYLTLRLCGLTTAELQVLPPVPLGAFLLMLTGGYLISFTLAGGQTIGKMAARVRVVPLPERDRGSGRVTLTSAVLRAAGCLASILMAGLGYVPALVSEDHRALHDRLAETRVVRA
jgi:uncharacterized RDD family membrane protein YckC